MKRRSIRRVATSIFAGACAIFLLATAAPLAAESPGLAHLASAALLLSLPIVIAGGILILARDAVAVVMVRFIKSQQRSRQRDE